MWGLDEVMFVKHSIQYTKYTPNSSGHLFSPGMSGRSWYLGNMLQSACDGKSAFWWRWSLSCPGAEGSHGRWTYQHISWPQAHLLKALPGWGEDLRGQPRACPRANHGECACSLWDSLFLITRGMGIIKLSLCVCVRMFSSRKYDNINPLDLDYYTMGETTYIWEVTRIYTFFFIHKGRETMYRAEGELNSLVLPLPWITTYAS